jgi:hypothetical protein
MPTYFIGLKWSICLLKKSQEVSAFFFFTSNGFKRGVPLDTEEQFNDHDNCYECYICFTPQVIADFHEVEYQPASTKLLVASGQPENNPRN